MTTGAFFKEHNFLVGLSVDGPRESHDTYRVDRSKQGTFDKGCRAGDSCVSTESNSTYCAQSTPRMRNTPHGLPLLQMRWAHSGCSSSRSSNAPVRRQSRSPTWLERAAVANACSTHNLATCNKPFVGGEQYGRFLVDIFEEWGGTT